MRRLGGTTIIVFAITLAVAVLAWPAVLSAQTSLKPEALVGKYEGSATSPDGTIQLKVELRLEKDALVGNGDTSAGPFSVTAVTISGDQVTMTIDFGGTPGTIKGVERGDKFEGTWAVADQSGSCTLTKLAATPASTGAPAAKPAATADDPISGQWDGITGQGDQTVGFALAMKLDGDKVTGSISSDQGGAQISSGSWKDGALTVTFDFNGMSATMIAALKDGKLVGTLDLGGQMQLPWAAVKKQ